MGQDQERKAVAKGTVIYFCVKFWLLGLREASWEKDAASPFQQSIKILFLPVYLMFMASVSKHQQ